MNKTLLGILAAAGLGTWAGCQPLTYRDAVKATVVEAHPIDYVGGTDCSKRRLLAKVEGLDEANGAKDGYHTLEVKGCQEERDYLAVLQPKSILYLGCYQIWPDDCLVVPVKCVYRVTADFSTK